MIITIYFTDNRVFTYSVDKISHYTNVENNKKYILLTKIVDEIENYVHIPVESIEKIEVE